MKLQAHLFALLLSGLPIATLYSQHSAQQISSKKRIPTNLLIVKSFDGKEDYSILADSLELQGVFTLHLLRKTSNGWTECDSFVLGERFGGDFKVLTMNSHHFIRVRRPDDATGYYREDEAYLGIFDGKFKTLFGFIRIEIISPEGQEDANWKIGKVSFVDLNKDGFIDIVHTERTQIVFQAQKEWEKFALTQIWLRIDDSQGFFGVKPKHIISTIKRKYIWNNTTWSFDQIQ